MSLLTLFDSGDSSRFEFQFNERLTTLPPFLTRLGATYTRNSLKNVLQDGALVSLSANTFGTSYDPVTSLYAYMPEPAATNLIINSQDFTQASWIKSNSSIISSNNSAPNSTNTAALLEMTSNAGYISRTITATAAAHTFSMYVKKGNTRYGFIEFNQTGDHGYIFDFDNNCAITATVGTPSDFLAVTIGGGWFRVSVTKTLSAASAIASITTSTASGTITRASGDNVYIWGAQLETGTRATSYILTTSGTAARAADVLSIPTANIAGFNEVGYTLFCDQRIDTVNATAKQTITLQGATYENSAYIGDQSTQLVYRIYPNSATPGVNTISAYSANTRQKAAMSAQLNNCLMSKNGASLTADTNTGMPTGLSTLHIGRSGAGSEINGYLYSATLYTRALTQAQLNAITL